MKTWNDYKEHVNQIDPATGKDIADMEEHARIISELIRQRLGLKPTGPCCSLRNTAIFCGTD